MTENKNAHPEEGHSVEPLPGLEEQIPDHEEAPPGVRTMAVVRWILIAAMAVLAAGSVLYYCGAFKSAGTSQAATQYYCPMHPSVVQDHPGECPICSMTLVKKEGGGQSKDATASPQGSESSQSMAGVEGMRNMAPPAGSSKPDTGMSSEVMGKAAAKSSAGTDGGLTGLTTVELTPERIQLIGMKTQRATREKLVSELRTVGFVAPDEQRLAQITTRFAGWIEQLFVSQTGQKVSRGQVLATIYSPELLTAQQEFLNARKWSSNADPDPSEHQLTSGLAQDARQRLELLGISREEIKELERTGRPMPALKIRSPVNGYVIQKSALPGMYIQPGAELFDVADLSKVWVLADIYEYEIGRIHLGEAARLQLAAFPGQTFKGRVQFIYPTLNAETRTLRIRIEFPNPDLNLRPGMYGDVVVELPGAEGLMISAEALVDTGEAQYVFVALAGGRFEPRQVRTGARTDSKVQVLAGLREGETVVSTGNFLLDSESRIRASIEGAVAAGGEREEEVPIDKTKYPDKYRQWKACEVEHRGMGTMEQDCKNVIPKPWR